MITNYHNTLENKSTATTTYEINRFDIIFEKSESENRYN